MHQYVIRVDSIEQRENTIIREELKIYVKGNSRLKWSDFIEGIVDIRITWERERVWKYEGWLISEWH